MGVTAARGWWIAAGLGLVGCSSLDPGLTGVTATDDTPVSSATNPSSASDAGTSGGSPTSDPMGSASGDPTSFTTSSSTDATTNATGPVDPPTTCAGRGGPAIAAEPTLALTLFDRWEEAWLGSAAVADLDGDGAQEIVVPRANALIAWSAAGELKWKTVAEGGRIWASPVVAQFDGDPELEVAFAAREKVYLLDHTGAIKPGFPVTWEDELRSLAAADIDGDGALDLAAAVARGTPTDVVHAWRADGSPVLGFPPNAKGSSGCDDKCYLAGCYDQNLALGDLDADGKADLVVPHDNAYVSIHQGSGAAFDAADIFPATKTPGVRYLHALAEAMQGYADDEQTALQAHFTNTPPTIADIDLDGTREILLLASVQNAAQTDRERGVALWAVRSDASRHPAFETPVHLPDYLSGLWDYGDNIVAITNQVAVADVRPEVPGLESVFVGFDGRIHAVSAAGQLLWSTDYTADADVAAAGVAIGDLSGDGLPEIVFNTYSTAQDKGHLFILGNDGLDQHKLPLPRRGAMPVPTLADVDGDGSAEIVVSLKDAEDKVESVLVYTVPGSSADCLPWPTARGNLLRDGLVP